MTIGASAFYCEQFGNLDIVLDHIDGKVSQAEHIYTTFHITLNHFDE